MPAGYIIAQVQVNDPEAYEKYRALVPATVAKFGGEFVVRGGRQEGLEGEAPAGRTVVLKFPSYDQALAWYRSDDYAGPKAMRQNASVGRMLVVEGA